MKISGTFDVKLSPRDLAAQGRDGIRLGRMSIHKSFTGDLEATSKGEMLSAMTPVQGSAGYVAIEQVSGSLKGRKGAQVGVASCCSISESWRAQATGYCLRSCRIPAPASSRVSREL